MTPHTAFDQTAYFVIKNQYANLFKNTLFDDSSDGDGYDATI